MALAVMQDGLGVVMAPGQKGGAMLQRLRLPIVVTWRNESSKIGYLLDNFSRSNLSKRYPRDIFSCSKISKVQLFAL